MIRRVGISLLVAACLAAGSSASAAGISFIRDAEIENTIRAYATPLFAAAGLEEGAIRVYIVKDRALNAFVAGGMNLFVNTGLLMASKSANQLIGVIAHETGHIAGGHLARTQDALRGASAATILATVLGAAAAVAGAPEAGLAIIGGGQKLAQSAVLKYSRVQEQAADQFALSVLDRTGQSAQGLAEFFGVLGDQEALLTTSQDPYVRTHPLTRERIRAVEEHVRHSPHSAKPDAPLYAEMHSRMVAKLRGFIDPPGRTFGRYPETDSSIEARYARAVAHYRVPDIEPALAESDSLIRDEPNNPFFRELKGQILFENGRIVEAAAAYGLAVERLPSSALLRIGLAHPLIETGLPKNVERAIGHLEKAVQTEPRNARAWCLLRIAYGRNDQIGLSTLASAENAMLAGRFADAQQMAKRAAKLLPEGSPGWLQAEDLARTAERALKKRGN